MITTKDGPREGIEPAPRHATANTKARSGQHQSTAQPVTKHTPTQTNHGWEVFWESTPQPVPKHTPTVTKAHPESVLWCLLGRALVFVGMCFPECALVVPECALASTGACFAKGWGPKKILKNRPKTMIPRNVKSAILLWF